jgi:tetratricopeptide (TPR) repeat protein
LYEKKQYNEALNVLKTALTVANLHADTYYWMARCYEALGDREQAIQNYQRTLSLDPDDDDARAGLRRVR